MDKLLFLISCVILSLGLLFNTHIVILFSLIFFLIDIIIFKHKTFSGYDIVGASLILIIILYLDWQKNNYFCFISVLVSLLIFRFSCKDKK